MYVSPPERPPERLPQRPPQRLPQRPPERLPGRPPRRPPHQLLVLIQIELVIVCSLLWPFFPFLSNFNIYVLLPRNMHKPVIYVVVLAPGFRLECLLFVVCTMLAFKRPSH